MQPTHLPIPLQELVQAIARATAEAVLDRFRSEQSAASMAAGSPLLSVKETCSYLKVSRSELHRLQQAGVLTRVRFGRRVFYPRAVLDDYISSRGAP